MKTPICNATLLARYLAGRIGGDDLLEFLCHADYCESCRRALMEVRRWEHRGNYKQPQLVPEPTGLAACVARVKAELPGDEIIELPWDENLSKDEAVELEAVTEEAIMTDEQIEGLQKRLEDLIHGRMEECDAEMILLEAQLGDLRQRKAELEGDLAYLCNGEIARKAAVKKPRHVTKTQGSPAIGRSKYGEAVLKVLESGEHVTRALFLKVRELVPALRQKAAGETLVYMAAVRLGERGLVKKRRSEALGKPWLWSLAVEQKTA